MGHVCRAELYDAVQRHRLPGIDTVCGVWRQRVAGGDPACRAAVRGGGPPAYCRRIREGDRIPQPAASRGLTDSASSLMDLRIDPAVDTVDLDLLTEAQRYVWLLRPDLRRAAGGAGLANIGDFLYWWYTRGIIEY